MRPSIQGRARSVAAYQRSKIRLWYSPDHGIGRPALLVQQTRTGAKGAGAGLVLFAAPCQQMCPSGLNPRSSRSLRLAKISRLVVRSET